MRTWLIALASISSCLIALAGCSPHRDEITFEVADQGLAADAALEIRLCDRIYPLSRAGSTLTATATVTCEGLAVLHDEKSGWSCNAGYVTNALSGQRYQVSVNNEKCTVRIVSPQELDPGTPMP
jgi:hypothetical protein